jgi:NAD-dependent dihydropyrimidine dehydrogenase PreA subunit
MCDSCFTHTKAGKQWFKDAKVYARQMYSRKRQQKQKEGKKRISGGAGAFEAAMGDLAGQAIAARNLNPEKYPDLLMAANKFTARIQGAQTVTLQETLDMIDLASPICFLACACRYMKFGYVETDRSKMTCLGLGIGMFKHEKFPTRYAAGAEWVSHKEAKEWITKWDEEGLVHNLMNFGYREGMPYIGGICNCSRADCGTISARLDYGHEQLKKGESVAFLDPDKCVGCKICIGRCQFGALKFDIRNKLAHINMLDCYGCGLCANSCKFDAIEMKNRRDFITLRYNW